ncbi:MAG: hypothetical protein WAJ93_01115 [Candidatus Nitrosopolaris sp.]
MYREYWETRHMYKLAQIYDEAKYNLHSLLRLHKILKDLGMGEQKIINEFELAKQNQLERLQGKVEYLRNEIFMLELQKSESTNDILNRSSSSIFSNTAYNELVFLLYCYYQFESKEWYCYFSYHL